MSFDGFHQQPGEGGALGGGLFHSTRPAALERRVFQSRHGLVSSSTLDSSPPPSIWHGRRQERDSNAVICLYLQASNTRTRQALQQSMQTHWLALSLHYSEWRGALARRAWMSACRPSKNDFAHKIQRILHARSPARVRLAEIINAVKC